MIVTSFFFFSSRRRHTRLQGDWSSDVCSSDLDRTAPERCFPAIPLPQVPEPRVALGEHRLLQLGGLPLFPPVGADVHPGNPAPTAPRDSADLPPAPVVKDHGVCRKRDDRDRKSTRLNSSHL